jgi:NAD(P)-dependent dehydrogenase (short-subunit alcohol dehydrogenase family)
MNDHPLDLNGRVILVTGASSGLGRATAILLSRLNARLIIAGRNAERLAETRAALQGGPHGAEVFDLAQADQIPRWIKGLAAQYGPLSGLAHLAGILSARPLKVLDPGHFEEVLRTNVVSAAQLVRGMRQNGCAAVPASAVLVASVMGLVGASGVAAYSASKGAVVALGRSLALEVAREKIRVNVLAPGFVETEMTDRLRTMLTAEQYAAIEAMHPLGIGRPEDVAHAAAFLLSDASRWVTGSTLVVDGGYTAR